MLIQEKEYRDFRKNECPAPISKGRTTAHKAALARRKQINAGKAIGEVMAIENARQAQIDGVANPEFFIPNDSAGHKPKKNGKKKEGKTKRKKKDQGKQDLLTLVSQLDAAKEVLAKKKEDTENEKEKNKKKEAYPKLGMSPNPRPVRALPSTKEKPNPTYITFFKVWV